MTALAWEWCGERKATPLLPESPEEPWGAPESTLDLGWGGLGCAPRFLVVKKTRVASGMGGAHGTSCIRCRKGRRRERKGERKSAERTEGLG